MDRRENIECTNNNIFKPKQIHIHKNENNKKEQLNLKKKKELIK